MYLEGVSVRRVEEITEALWGTKVSPGTISNINKKHMSIWKPGVHAHWLTVIHMSVLMASILNAARGESKNVSIFLPLASATMAAVRLSVHLKV